MNYPDLNRSIWDNKECQRSITSSGECNLMTKSKAVVLWGIEDILISSVESILSSKKGWEVISLSNKEDIDALIQAVESSHASMVIMQEGEKSDPIFLPMQLIRDIPSLRVITVSLENNSMEVFSKQQILVKDVADLISVFGNEPLPINHDRIKKFSQEKGGQPETN